MEPNLPYNARIKLALTYLAEQERPKCRQTAERYEVSYTTLPRRFKGEQVSKAIAIANVRQRLTIQQEEVLIKYLNKLSDRCILPTSQIVKNIAEEIISGELGKNWVGQFVKE
jgi:hypothetical protein